MNDIDWQEELKKWIAAAKKNESIFLETDLSGWNEAGERRHRNHQQLRIRTATMRHMDCNSNRDDRASRTGCGIRHTSKVKGGNR